MQDVVNLVQLLKFQSTPSARRATVSFGSKIMGVLDFNPRPPRGGRPRDLRRFDGLDEISIHALREESDVDQLETLQMQLEISIHALREESDGSSA